MLYLYIESDDQTSFSPPMSSWAEGSYAFPDEFLSEYYKEGKRAAGFVRVTHDEMNVLSCTWDEEAYQTWCAENPESDYLTDNKKSKIAQSKTDLSAYLESHPLQWADGEYYSITAEKQAQLTSTLVCAQADGQPPEWNSTGGVCRAWDVQELTALGVAIKNRVKALVKYQQEKELEILAAETKEALDAIEVDYDTVPVPQLSEANQ